MLEAETRRSAEFLGTGSEAQSSGKRAGKLLIAGEWKQNQKCWIECRGECRVNHPGRVRTRR
jgi:hypothetical protein